MMMRGGNAKEVVSRIKARVKEINEKKMLPGNLEIKPFYDRSELVDAALLTVIKVLIEGAILVIAILFLFLGDVRSSLIVVMTLLLTPLMTFMAMNYFGISANLMSLGGLTIAIGLMVDGSVVVVENTFHRLGHDKNTGKLRIILESATEVGKPVLFGVGIIILVFLLHNHLPIYPAQNIKIIGFKYLHYLIFLTIICSILSFLLLNICRYYYKKIIVIKSHKWHFIPIIFGLIVATIGIYFGIYSIGGGIRTTNQVLSNPQEILGYKEFFGNRITREMSIICYLG
jgi:cobalt-zinc-cadmium resistance protein CzcA